MTFTWWDQCGALAVDSDGRLWRWDGDTWRRLGPLGAQLKLGAQDIPCLSKLAAAWAAADDRDQLIAEANAVFYAGLKR
jgi:hypothetical protein